MYEVKLYDTKLGTWVPERTDERHTYPDLATTIHFLERAKFDEDEISYITINGKICPSIKSAIENCIFVGIKKEDKPMNNDKFIIDNLSPAEYDIATKAIRKHRDEQNAWDEFMAAYDKCEKAMGHELMMEYLGDFYGLSEESEEEYEEEYDDDERNDESNDTAADSNELDEIIRKWFDKNNL